MTQVSSYLSNLYTYMNSCSILSNQINLFSSSFIIFDYLKMYLIGPGPSTEKNVSLFFNCDDHTDKIVNNDQHLIIGNELYEENEQISSNPSPIENSPLNNGTIIYFQLIFLGKL